MGFCSGAPMNSGDLMVMLSAPNWAVYTILSRRLLGRMEASRMIFYVMLAGWLFITLWAVGFGPGTREIGPSAPPAGWQSPGWVCSARVWRTSCITMHCTSFPHLSWECFSILSPL